MSNPAALLIVPIATALAGYLANRVGQWMIFHLLLPRRAGRFSQEVARLLAEKLLSPRELARKLDVAEIEKRLARTIDQQTREVTREAISYADPPLKMEAGTPAIVSVIGLGAALEYMEGLGLDGIAAHERRLRDYASERLLGLNWLNVQGRAPGKGAIFSFTLDGAAHPHDISTIVDRKGVAVRAGHHCAQPLMAHLGLTATCRASFGLYNTTAEVDALVDALETCHELFA